MNTLKKYRFSVFGEFYTLVSDESEDQLTASVDQVDGIMREISQQSGLSDTARIAVLASLQLACKLKNTEMKLEQSLRKELELVDLIDRELPTML